MKRIEKIKSLRKKKMSYNKIGKQFGISGERVRQLITPKVYQLCKKHSYKFIKTCPICFVKERYKNLQLRDLINEVKELSKYDRTLEKIEARKLLIHKLRDEFNFSFKLIGRLLKRNLSTIKHLYDRE